VNTKCGTPEMLRRHMLCVISSSTSFLPLSDFMYSSTCFGHTPRRTAGWSQGERRARRWVPGVRPSPYHGQTGLLANLSQQREVAEVLPILKVRLEERLHDLVLLAVLARVVDEAVAVERVGHLAGRVETDALLEACASEVSTSKWPAMVAALVAVGLSPVSGVQPHNEPMRARCSWIWMARSPNFSFSRAALSTPSSGKVGSR